MMPGKEIVSVDSFVGISQYSIFASSLKFDSAANLKTFKYSDEKLSLIEDAIFWILGIYTFKTESNESTRYDCEI